MKQKYQEYLKLNKNILLAFFGSIIISAIAADYFADQADYLNSSFTLIIDYVVFFSIFGSLFYFDNRKKYVLENGQRDNTLLKSDLIKIISSLWEKCRVISIHGWSSLNLPLKAETAKSHILKSASPSPRQDAF